MDPRTPVIVGAGQVTNRRERVVDPLTLMEEASRAAGRDAGGDALARVSSVQVPNVVSWSYPAPASTLAAALGLDEVETITTTVGGSTPQWLVSEACERIARGEIEGALIAGAEALDSARRAAKEGRPLDRGNRAEVGEDRVIGDDRPPVNDAEIRAGIVAPASIYPMFEQVLAHRDGRTPEEQRTWLGELMAPFTQVASSNPGSAWFTEELRPEDISTVSATNRMVAEPYTKNLNAILQVDMGAALILLSAGAAEAAGVPRERWVFPWSGAKCDDVYLVAERPDLGRALGLAAAARAALEAAGTGIDEVDHIDIYSCFPSAVQMGAEALGISLDDPRGLTVTGGLPFFGGPGNNYVTHAIATLVERLRAESSSVGIATGVSWYMSKHAIGVYSGSPPKNGWRYPDTSKHQAEIGAEVFEVAKAPDGKATVEAFTVEHDREKGPARAPIYARLEDGKRVVARAVDRSTAAALSGRSIIGTEVRVRSGEGATVYEI